MDDLGIQIVPLVPNIELPRRASARTRAAVPPGYGVQEHCLPFTAASGLGFRIPSPIRFGHCPVNEVPEDCHSFRSPLPVDGPQADWVFYVADNPLCRFARNAFSLVHVPVAGAVEPGISFFGRSDQQDTFKLHLPYIWRTPAEIDTLFLPLLNRSARGLEVQCGLVETQWYSNPVNLILRKAAHSVHFRAGDEIAHALLVSRQHRNAPVTVAESHSRLTREALRSLLEWHKLHAGNRSAYKVLARSAHGRVDP